MNTGKNPRYSINDKVFIDVENEIRECRIIDIVETLVNGKYEAAYALETPFGICRRYEDEVYTTKGEAMDAYGYEFTIWAMCPYCENEVELYTTKMTECPRCGAHFEPSEEEIEASLEEQ